jgi:DNA-binding CsgD family transcriptional regulator/pimeloyl-ACP methyl ester carboxylesterase
MEPEIRFCRAADGTRIGYAVLGKAGTPLVIVESWGATIETEWENAGCRSAYQRLAARRRPIIVSRRGFGPSQRDVEDISLEAQTSDIAAVADALNLTDFDLWGFFDGIGPAVAFAAANPARVSKLILWDAFVRGRDLVEERAAQAMINLIRANWRLATRTLADLALPTGPTSDQFWLTRQWRRTVAPEMVARYFEFLFGLDLSNYLPELQASTLVLHRRDDRVVPLPQARIAAAMIPKSRFLTLEGDIAYAWLGDTSYFDSVDSFLDEDRPPAQAPVSLALGRLSAREIEVLRLLALGKTNQEIAEALVISLNTVAHHVTNILNKAGLANRTEAAAYAHRSGIVRE